MWTLFPSGRALEVCAVSFPFIRVASVLQRKVWCYLCTHLSTGKYIIKHSVCGAGVGIGQFLDWQRGLSCLYARRRYVTPTRSWTILLYSAKDSLSRRTYVLRFYCYICETELCIQISILCLVASHGSAVSYSNCKELNQRLLTDKIL